VLAGNGEGNGDQSTDAPFLSLRGQEGRDEGAIASERRSP
jgi:hypothetical protein